MALPSFDMLIVARENLRLSVDLGQAFTTENLSQEMRQLGQRGLMPTSTKHSGCSFANVVREHPAYVRWILHNVVTVVTVEGSSRVQCPDRWRTFLCYTMAVSLNPENMLAAHPLTSREKKKTSSNSNKALRFLIATT